MRRFFFKDFLNLYDIICIYGITWLATHSLWFLLLIIPAIWFAGSADGKKPSIEITIVDHSGANHQARLVTKPHKVSVPTCRKFPDEASWNKTMTNKDRHALLQAFGYIQHRLLCHPEAGIQGKVSLERVQKWIEELK